MTKLNWDEPPELTECACSWCGITHANSRGFILDERGAFAIEHTEWHPKHLAAFVEITLGDFSDPTWSSNVTFGVQLCTPDAESVDPVVLIQSAREPEKPVFGARPSAAEALSHPRIDDMWTVLEWVVVNDPLLAGKFPAHNL